MKNNNFKIYGKTVNKWLVTTEQGWDVWIQAEIAYKKYDENFELVGEGTEDFSDKRYHKTIVEKRVFVWDGERRNKGGFRWFKYEGWVKFNRKDVSLVKAFIKAKYNAAEVDLR